MPSYTLKVVDIKKETADTVTLCFKQPALRKMKYKAGQYLSLIFRINGRRYVRPYSFSSNPLADPLVEVTVKRVFNGIVSNHIHDEVQIGDTIEVLEPMGDFIFEEKKYVKDIYLWGAGSGITPLISLIKEVLYNTESLKANLIYGNRNVDTTIFSNTINALLNNYPKRFNVWHFYTQLNISECYPYIVEGRISKNYVLDILKDTNVLNTAHYICGPAGLKELVKEALNILIVPPENIFSEDFELIKEPKQFEYLHTRIITLSFHEKVYNLEIIKGKSILESALESGLELPYSCQTGDCSTCKALCLDGEVKMIGLAKERNDLAINEYLLCCTYPLTDNVHITI